MTRPPAMPLTVSLRAAPAAATAPRGAPVALRSKGFVLRSLQPSDASPEFLGWLSDPEMLRGLNLGALSFTLPQLRNFIAGFDNLNGFFVGIFDEASGALVGFYTIDVNRTHRVGQITTGIGDRRFVGRGTLWATIDVLLDHMFAERGVEKIVARVLARNHRMLFNFIGNPRFVLEARLRHECLAPDGTRQDILVFAAFRTAPTPLPPVGMP